MLHCRRHGSAVAAREQTVYDTCRVVVIMAQLISNDSCTTEDKEQLPPSKRQELEDASSQSIYLYIEWLEAIAIVQSEQDERTQVMALV